MSQLTSCRLAVRPAHVRSTNDARCHRKVAVKVLAKKEFVTVEFHFRLRV